MNSRMFRKAVLCLFACVAIAWSQSATPNIGLNIVSYASPQWDVPLNQNANILDLLLSGNQALKGLMFVCQSTPPLSPASGFVRLYLNCSDGLLHTKNSAGADVPIGNSGTGVTSTGTLTNGNVVIGAGGTVVSDSGTALGSLVTIDGGQVLTHKSIDAGQLTGTINVARFGFTPENQANKGIAGGYAPLDSSSAVPLANLPAIPFAATAGALSATPTLCPTGQAPTGVLPNGNATGCAVTGSTSLQPPTSGAGLLTGSALSTVTATTTVAGALGYTPQNAAVGNANNDALGAAATALSTAQAFASNASNLTSGTIPTARVPTLNQNTTGNAATATALAVAPQLCPTGQAPTGVLANGDATGCALISGGSGSGLQPPSAGFGILTGASGSTATSVTTVAAALGYTPQNAATANPNNDAVGAAATAQANAETFSANAANLSSGIIPMARFPTLNQNTTGSAATLAGTPTLCPTGQAPTGILANGNATGCAIIGGGGGGSGTVGSGTTGQFGYYSATGNAIVGRTLIPSDIPVLNQNTTGQAGTALALAATPSQAATNQFCTGITASGNCNSAAVNYSQLVGTNPASAGAALGSSALQPPSSGSGLLTGGSGTTATAVTTVASALGYTPQNAATANANNDALGAAATALTTAEAFSSNASNLSSGTVATARIPTLNQNTTGNAATATALASTPTLCPTGQAPTGILANGNSTGCAAIGGGSGGGLQPPTSGFGILTGASGSTATGVTTVATALGYTPQNAATANSNNDALGAATTAQSNAETFASNAANLTSGTIPLGRFPTLNQNTTGTAAALTGTPTLCPTGQAPTGILANGNATGCAAIGGGGGSSFQSAGALSGRPSTCTPGVGVYQYLATDQPLNQQTYICTSTNTWTQGPINLTGGNLLLIGGALGTNPATIPTLGSANSFTGVNTFQSGTVSGLTSGLNSVSFTPLSGAGTGATAACQASHVCDSNSGSVALTMGTSTSVAYALAINLGAHTNIPNCVVNYQTTATLTSQPYRYTTTTTTLSIFPNVAPTASEIYLVTYSCNGI